MLIDVSGLGHSFTSRGSGAERDDVLRDIGLRVGAGEVVALVGPSGSGKSTLLNILGGLLAVQRGVYRFGGRTISGPRQRQWLRARGVAWVFQAANLLPERTAVDNAAIALLGRGYSTDVSRVVAAHHLVGVGLGHRLGHRASQLSGGEAQRACIARALTVGAPLILADEPTGALDRATSDEVVDAIIACRSAGTAIVLATHDMRVAARCDRIVELVDGRVQIASGVHP